MNAGRLISLAVVAIGLLALALWLAGERRPVQTSEMQSPLAAGLSARLNDVERVRLVGAGAATLATIERRAQQWVLAERNDYPVDAVRLRELLLALAEARRIEPKTANPERHARLGVEDVAAADASGVRVEIDAGDAQWRIIIGDRQPSGGSYARVADAAESWLLDRAVTVEKKPELWLQRELTDIGVERIERVDVQPEQGPAIAIGRTDDAAGDFRLLGLPRGREQASEFVADSTAGLLSALRFDDVLPTDAVVAPDAVRHSRFLTREGLRIELESWQLDGHTYARLDAALDDAQAARWIDTQQAESAASWQAAQPGDGGQPEPAATDVEPPPATAADTSEELAPAAPLAVTDPAADREQRLQALRDEVDTLDARFAGRVFILPGFKAGNLNRDLDAYLKPKT